MLVVKADEQEFDRQTKMASKQKSRSPQGTNLAIDASDDSPESMPVSLNKPLKSRFETESIETLLALIDRGRINLQPEYQRENDIWSLRRQQRLIESILMGIVIPAIYLVERQVHEEVVDGLQRLTTIQRFVRNEFVLAEDCQIPGATYTQSERNARQIGKSFLQLSEEARNHILMTRIPLIRVTMDKDTALSDIIHETFARLQCGIPLNAIEVIQASYASPFMQTLKDLAKAPVFLQFFNISNKRARSLGHLLTLLLLHRKEFKDSGINIYSQIKELCGGIIKAGEESLAGAIKDVIKLLAATEKVDMAVQAYSKAEPSDKTLAGFFGADAGNPLDVSLCVLRRTSLVLHIAKDDSLEAKSLDVRNREIAQLAKQVLRIQDIAEEGVYSVAHSKARGVANYKLMSLLALDLEQHKNPYIH